MDSNILITVTYSYIDVFSQSALCLSVASIEIPLFIVAVLKVESNSQNVIDM